MVRSRRTGPFAGITNISGAMRRAGGRSSITITRSPQPFSTGCIVCGAGLICSISAFMGLKCSTGVLAKGCGCLLLGSHLGSFEVVRAVGLSRERIAVKVLMDEQNAPMIRALIQE